MDQNLPAVENAPHEVSRASAGIVADAFEFVNVDPQTATIDLVELKVWPPRQGERSQIFPIWPELRVAEETIITDGWRITVHLNRAELVAQFDGCNVAPGTRYGDNPLSPSVEMTETEIGETDFSRSGEAAAELSASAIKGISAGIEMKAAGKALVRNKTATERRSEIVQQRVGTLPNNRWEVIEPRGHQLRGSYLVAPAAEVAKEKPLCRVVANSDTVKITLSLEVRPHDIDPKISAIEDIKWPGWPSKEKPNRNKIAKLLVIKACTECFVRPADERITLARAVLQGRRLTPKMVPPDDASK